MRAHASWECAHASKTREVNLSWYCCWCATTGMLEDEADTLEPEAIAKIVLSGIRKGNAQIATSLDGWMLAILTCGMLRPHSITSFAAEVESP